MDADTPTGQKSDDSAGTSRHVGDDDGVPAPVGFRFVLALTPFLLAACVFAALRTLL